MNYYNSIKEYLINNEAIKRVKDYSKNKSDIDTYLKVGNLLVDAGKHYGENILKEYSTKLTQELGKGYTISALKRMRQFYQVIQKGATLSHQLTWSHYCEIIPLKNIEKINYYIELCLEECLSIRELRDKIKYNEYERNIQVLKIPKNSKKKLNNLKNPLIIKNHKMNIKISEKILHKLILEDISHFLKELGTGFAYVSSEYKIKLGDRYNYIDFLLYNIELKCFVVVELKITELKKEHIGQIETYIKYIDSNKKTNSQNKTIGIILCKRDNRFIMEYCSDPRIISREYLLIKE